MAGGVLSSAFISPLIYEDEGCFRFLEAAFRESKVGEGSPESSSSRGSPAFEWMAFAGVFAVRDRVRVYGEASATIFFVGASRAEV